MSVVVLGVSVRVACLAGPIALLFVNGIEATTFFLAGERFSSRCYWFDFLCSSGLCVNVCLMTTVHITSFLKPHGVVSFLF